MTSVLRPSRTPILADGWCSLTRSDIRVGPAIAWAVPDQNANMTTEQVDKIRAANVLARVKKSQAINALATWSVDDHRRFMADVLIAAGLALPQSEVVDILKLIDNHSATQQNLERQYGSTGHFVRRVKGAISFDTMMAELAKEAGVKPETVSETK